MSESETTQGVDVKPLKDFFDGVKEGRTPDPLPFTPPPRLPARRGPYFVTYSVEGGHLYEMLVPGDSTVVAVDGRLQISHRDHAVLGIVQVKPFEPLGEESHGADHEGGEEPAG